MIHCEGLVKIYKLAELEVVALQGLDLRVEEGEDGLIIPYTPEDRKTG